MEMVEANPSINWDWYMLSENPNLTIDYIIEHPDKDYNKEKISENTFEKERRNFIDKKLREHIASLQIQGQWKKTYYSPDTRIGTKRLLKSYEELFGELN